jgi:hypothetical protein
MKRLAFALPVIQRHQRQPRRCGHAARAARGSKCVTVPPCEPKTRREREEESRGLAPPFRRAASSPHTSYERHGARSLSRPLRPAAVKHCAAATRRECQLGLRPRAHACGRGRVALMAKRAPLDLGGFILRARALNLYREALRTVRQAPPHAQGARRRPQTTERLRRRVGTRAPAPRVNARTPSVRMRMARVRAFARVQRRRERTAALMLSSSDSPLDTSPPPSPRPRRRGGRHRGGRNRGSSVRQRIVAFQAGGPLPVFAPA